MIDEQLDADEAEIAEVAGILNLANARFVAVTERVLRGDSWVGTGVHSPTQWLAYRAGVSPERAKAIVQVASRRASFPEVISSFGSTIRIRNRATSRCGSCSAQPLVIPSCLRSPPALRDGGPT